MSALVFKTSVESFDCMLCCMHTMDSSDPPLSATPADRLMSAILSFDCQRVYKVYLHLRVSDCMHGRLCFCYVEVQEYFQF